MEDPPWHWDDDFDDDEFWYSNGFDERSTLSFFTKLLLDPSPLDAYNRDQVAQGLWFLLGDSTPGGPQKAVFESSLSLNDRIACVEAIVPFFRDWVIPQTPSSIHDEGSGDSLTGTIFMWWDVFASRGSSDPSERPIDLACLQVMQEILMMYLSICRESALHGLGHWHESYPEAVERIIGEFLDREVAIEPDLRRYALQAQEGSVQ